MNMNAKTIEEEVENLIYSCLDLKNPKSFFVFAGAGSGKTRSLINILSRFEQRDGRQLFLKGRKIAIITYTNAACDEIKRRLGFNLLYDVSTIHSFIWNLIQDFQIDIKAWIKSNLELEIASIKADQVKGKPGSQASKDRERSISAKSQRLIDLEKIRKFIYNPNGNNSSFDSLNHSEVIKLGSDFLTNKNLMQDILINKYPILLIDESQDTKKELIEALFQVQANKREYFTLGLFGDIMQRIYNEGKEDLGRVLPKDWVRPIKKFNYRCPNRIIQLINKIRSEVDEQIQNPGIEKEDGLVRLFIVKSETQNKADVENFIMKRMATLSNDEHWGSSETEVKILILEHHMAAKRMGFSEFFEPLYKNERLSTGVLDGSLSGIRFFTKIILPLMAAKLEGNEFEVASIVREYSPYLRRDNIKIQSDQIEIIRYANDAVNELASLWKKGSIPRLIDILQAVARLKLFDIPDSLRPIAFRTSEEQIQGEKEFGDYTEGELKEDVLKTWESALACSYNQIIAYHEYFSEKGKFGTHQGVKGLEFPRVMVILDDEESRGFLFSYEKLFGAKSLTATDLKNEKEGKETSVERTRRLFYVTCSRAEKSLAIVAYTADPIKVSESVISQGWFEKDEIEFIE